jgi:hypothetical protein
MRFVSAEIGNYELQALLLLNKGILDRPQFLLFLRKFRSQTIKCHLGSGGQRVPLCQSWRFGSHASTPAS